MDTIQLTPQHILLGLTPDTIERVRRKVLTALIASTIVVGVMLAEDFQLIKQSSRAVAHKIKKAARPRRGTKPLTLPMPWK